MEKHSINVNNVISLGRSLLSDSDLRPRNIDSIPRTIHSIEQRWVALKDLMRKRKLE